MTAVMSTKDQEHKEGITVWGFRTSHPHDVPVWHMGCFGLEATETL